MYLGSHLPQKRSLLGLGLGLPSASPASHTLLTQVPCMAYNFEVLTTSSSGVFLAENRRPTFFGPDVKLGRPSSCYYSSSMDMVERLIVDMTLSVMSAYRMIGR